MKKNKSAKTESPFYFGKKGKKIQKKVHKGFWGFMDCTRGFGRFIKNRPFFSIALVTLCIPMVVGIIGGTGILTPALLAVLPLISIFAVMSSLSGENSKFYNRRVEEVKQRIKDDLNYTKIEEKSLHIEKSLINLRKEAFNNIENEIYQKKVNIVDNRFQKLRDDLRDIDRNILKTEVIGILTYGKDLNIIKLEDDMVKQKMLQYITKRLNILDDELSVVNILVNKLCFEAQPESKDFLSILDKTNKNIEKFKFIDYNKISKNLQNDFEDITLEIEKIKDVYDNLTYKEIDEELKNIKELYSKLSNLNDRLKIFRKNYLALKSGNKNKFEKKENSLNQTLNQNPIGKFLIKDKNDIRNYFDIT